MIYNKEKIMKKILISLLILPVFVFAELNIPKVNKTLQGILANKDLTFYNANNKIKLKGNLHLTTLKKADIVVFAKKPSKHKMTIVNSYKALRADTKSIGAIYEKKGRTQIVFVKERLDANGLVLSPSLKKHLLHQWQLNTLSLLNNIK